MLQVGACKTHIVPLSKGWPIFHLQAPPPARLPIMHFMIPSSASWDVAPLGRRPYTHLTQIQILSLSPHSFPNIFLLYSVSKPTTFIEWRKISELDSWHSFWSADQHCSLCLRPFACPPPTHSHTVLAPGKAHQPLRACVRVNKHFESIYIGASSSFWPVLRYKLHLELLYVFLKFRLPSRSFAVSFRHWLITPPSIFCPDLLKPRSFLCSLPVLPVSLYEFSVFHSHFRLSQNGHLSTTHQAPSSTHLSNCYKFHFPQLLAHSENLLLHKLCRIAHPARAGCWPGNLEKIMYKTTCSILHYPSLNLELLFDPKLYTISYKSSES